MLILTLSKTFFLFILSCDTKDKWRMGVFSETVIQLRIKLFTVIRWKILVFNYKTEI